ncbi:MAG: hypothetical protein LBJ36_08845 [Synergistaceae bacterium]|nr:hypothetical protein [Synergistaceae bacterium]
MKSRFERLKNIHLPSSIDFLEKDGDTLIMQMASRGFGWGDQPMNMQNDGAAFEAWALVAKTHEYDKVILKGDVPDSLDLSRLHYNRFLYRAQRFYENFDWFSLSDNLNSATSVFCCEVFDKNRNLKLNAPLHSRTSESHNPEAQAERHFIESPDKLRELTQINASEFFRQLPVGLCSEEVRIFPGRKAAIDLWAIEGDCVHVIELKAKGNKLGTLSELFFYVNFVYDFYCLKLASPEHISENRGYAKLLTSSPKRVYGHILAESKHPLLDLALAQLAQCKNKNMHFKQAITY